MKRYYILLFSLFAVALTVSAQECTVRGTVRMKESGKAVHHAEVFIQGTSWMGETNSRGEYVIRNVKPGTYIIAVFYPEMESETKELTLHEGENFLEFELKEISKELEEVTIEAEEISNNGIRRLRSVEGAVIYEAKKTEVIQLSDLNANLATNNPRQIYAKVPGLNIWESDGAGLQLGIGARGLDPNRTSNFNVRQNGYDISADALGYPESYYTPPSEALDRIEVVRGAASLQYGTQFGGLLNFVLQDGSESKPFEVTSRQSFGSFGLFNSFNSVGGKKGKVKYYTYFQHKQGDGWRPNSSFDLNAAYATIAFTPSENFSVTAQYTFMHYLAQQPGGLTDAMFEEDPQQSIRTRNWFQVNWNLMSLQADYKFSDRWKLNARLFGLIGGRDAVGNLGRIDRADDFEERDLFVDDFNNFGAELRLVHYYQAFHRPSVLVVGSRYYNGFTHRRQGLGTDGSDANFNFNNPDRLEGSDYDFPGNNVSLFAENIFNLTDRFSVTPGLRVERIETKADGYYQTKVLVPDPDTGIAEDSVFWVDEYRNRTRSFLIAGVGLSYKIKETIEIYGNLSQNYRAINFNDIRVVNPNLVVDPQIHDEEGFNADLGIRGGRDGIANFDVSLFYLKYKGRIGSVLQVDEETYRIYRYRTNVADSRHVGIEAFGQVDLLTFGNTNHNHKLFLFGNVALIDAVYVNAQEEVIQGNEVELVPRFNAKAGITWQWNKFQMTWQTAYTSDQYSDATNAEYTPSAVEGLIPAYHVMDLSARYHYKWLTLESGVNNLTNQMYFTRRAAGYPGPGIIPSDARNFYVTLQVKF